MRKLLLSTLILFTFCDTDAQTCIAFEDTTLTMNVSQTSYAAPFYSNSGIDFRCKFVSGFNSPPIPTLDVAPVSVWSSYNPNFTGNVLILGDVAVQVDFSSLSYTNKKIKFDISYASVPTDVNAFNVNGTGFTTLPSGVVYSYTTLSAGIQVQITGPINTIEFNGFEVAIDNICVEEEFLSPGCIGLEDTTLSMNISQTSYTTPFYSNSGIDFKCKFVNGFNTPPIPTLDIAPMSVWSTYNTNFAGYVLVLGDVAVQADFSGLSYTNKKITFDISYATTPTNVNAFNVNGAGLNTLPSGIAYTYTALSAGIHVQITGAINTIEFNGFEVAVDNICVEEIITTSISEKHKTNTFVIYPNPVEKLLSAKSDYNLTKVKIYNMSGIVLINESINKENHYQLDVNSFEKGAYFIEFTTDNNKIITQKFIKQ